MLHACHILWDLAGRPAPTNQANGHGRCALCGIEGPLHATIGSNFTDYRKLARIDGTRMCVACSWTFGGKPPHTLRMWSVVARFDRPAPPSQPGAYVSGPNLHLTSRKDLRWVAETLAGPPADGTPWLVAVTESRQKHAAPFTAVNYGAARWSAQLDSCDITSTPDEWRMVLSHTAALRAAGFAAAGIKSGCPPVAALAGENLAVWRSNAPPLAPYRGTPLLHLANLTITKETLGDYVATYPTT